MGIKKYFPETHQIDVKSGFNENYFHSLFVGITFPLIHFPRILYVTALRPFIFGIGGTILFLVFTPIMGILGLIKFKDVSEEEVRARAALDTIERMVKTVNKIENDLK